MGVKYDRFNLNFHKISLAFFDLGVNLPKIGGNDHQLENINKIKKTDNFLIIDSEDNFNSDEYFSLKISLGNTSCCDINVVTLLCSNQCKLEQ